MAVLPKRNNNLVLLKVFRNYFSFSLGFLSNSKTDLDQSMVMANTGTHIFSCMPRVSTYS